MNFKGAAKRLDDIDLPKLGALIGVGEDEIHAFIDVETRGSGFDPRGRPVILFERHKFYKYVQAARRGQAVNAGLANRSPGGYGKESEQYGRLLRAIAIDRNAALYSCSWGLAQVMGFNHKLAGYDTVEAMVAAFMDDEETHLRAAVTFIKNAKLDDELRAHDWAGFAKGYNGANYRINAYDTKLANAYRKWSRIKDTPWTPYTAPIPPQKPPVAPSVAEDLPAAPAENATVTIADGPKKDETIVVVAKTPQAPPASPGLPTSKTGFAALAAIIIALITGVIKYFGG